MDPAASRNRARRLALAAIAVAVLIAGAAFGLGRLSSPTSAHPSTTSAEAGFARDMQTHHQQAVELSMLVRDRTDDTDLRLIAYDIALTQSQQAGQLYGWLTQWGLPQASSEPSMTWMSRPPLGAAPGEHGHDGSAGPGHTPGSPMPGMATPAQVAQLTGARGPEAEVLFLRLMIDHHAGGIEMAEAVLDRSTDPVVTAFARGILSAQAAEIEAMTALLDARG